MDAKGYIFDYGGTLDSDGCHWGRVFWHAYERAGLPVGEAQFREAYVAVERRLGREAVIKPDFTFRQTLEIKVAMQLEAMGITEASVAGLPCCGGVAASEAVTSIVADLHASAVRHTAQARRVLGQLKAPKALVTNFYGNMPMVLREMQLADLFSAVIESAVVGVRKPDERIFLLGAKALSLSPHEIVVVGDSMANDIAPAHAAGFLTVWLRGEPWGTLSNGRWTEEAVDTAAADFVIDDLSALTTI